MRAPPPDDFGVKQLHRRGSARGKYIPAQLRNILASFAPCFTAPSFENFVALVSGWIACSGRRCITRVIQAAGGPASSKHFASLYRFLSRAKWSPDEVGRVLFQLLLRWLPADIDVLVDDTLCHRSGPHIFGAAMHYDANRSTYSGAGGRKVSFSFGQNWVVLAVRVPLPWDKARGIAVPILFRLYRSKRRCPEGSYRKRTELAVELIRLLETWVPGSHRLYVTGDAEYACRTLVRQISQKTAFIGPVVMNAALYEPAPSYQGMGRPALKGGRLPSPGQLASTNTAPWQSKTVHIYGRDVELLVKTFTALWFTVAGQQLVRVVVTRDPVGRIADRAYFATQPDMTVEELLQRFSRRWMLEVCFRDAKQHLGIEDPQNGWGRRRRKVGRAGKRAGPQPRGRRGEIATLHTLPIAFAAYAVVVLWYLEHGRPARDLRLLRRCSPWYRSKSTLSFADMLSALRAEVWAGRLSRDPARGRSRRKLRDRLCEALRCA